MENKREESCQRIKTDTNKGIRENNPRNERGNEVESVKERDQLLMRSEDGDDNGDNGSHSGQDGQLANSSLALETPSAEGENASK